MSDCPRLYETRSDLGLEPGLDTRTMRAPKVLYGGRLELHHPKLESLNS